MNGNLPQQDSYRILQQVALPRTCSSPYPFGFYCLKPTPLKRPLDQVSTFCRLPIISRFLRTIPVKISSRRIFLSISSAFCGSTPSSSLASAGLFFMISSMTFFGNSFESAAICFPFSPSSHPSILKASFTRHSFRNSSRYLQMKTPILPHHHCCHWQLLARHQLHQLHLQLWV
jgi:hypothetical protein